MIGSFERMKRKLNLLEIWQLKIVADLERAKKEMAIFWGYEKGEKRYYQTDPLEEFHQAYSCISQLPKGIAI